MQHCGVNGGEPETGTDLHVTAGVPRGHHARHRRCRGDLPDLLLEDGAGHVGVQHGVDAGTSAALVGARKDAQSQPGYGAEHRERLRLYVLRVLQVARRIIDYIERKRAALSRPPGREQVGDVAHPRAEVFRLAGAKQATVSLEQRSAPGAVDHDEVGPMAECPQVLARERLGSGAVAGMFVQGAAAALAVDLHDTKPLASSTRRVASFT